MDCGAADEDEAGCAVNGNPVLGVEEVVAAGGAHNGGTVEEDDGSATPADVEEGPEDEDELGRACSGFVANRTGGPVRITTSSVSGFVQGPVTVTRRVVGGGACRLNENPLLLLMKNMQFSAASAFASSSLMEK